MVDSLDITEVARRTGLTTRALRFYEARGLVTPLRSYNGRRHYGPAELERVHQIVMLKRAGLSLSDIGRMSARRPIDLGQLIEAKLAAIADQAAALRALWDEFEANETPDARFAKSLDRFQPPNQNLAAGGGSWTDYNVSFDTLVDRVGSKIAHGAPGLWDWINPRIRAFFGV